MTREELTEEINHCFRMADSLEHAFLKNAKWGAINEKKIWIEKAKKLIEERKGFLQSQINDEKRKEIAKKVLTKTKK